MDPLPQEILYRKRLGEELREDEIAFVVRGLSDGSLADAQVGAFAMAVALNGLSPRETTALTLGMRDSGRRMSWPNLPGPVLDKHSTGGVGDKVSLVLAPLVAACGGFVPMISGRGLGHTGGTSDKLESIPNYRTTPDQNAFRAAVRDVGCAIVGQSDDLAPADRRLYAIRDVTGTVESVPLITASILSKKLAAGLDALVMDVKVGSGAFLPTRRSARVLARSIVGVAREAGLRCHALLTSMDECLGVTAGNALEVREALAMLRGGEHRSRLARVVLALAAEMLVEGGLAEDEGGAAAKLSTALASGAAAECFARMVAALGGPVDFVDRPGDFLAAAPIARPVMAGRSGFVVGVNVRALGLAVVALGGGRTTPSGAIDHAVGLDEAAGLGTDAAKVPLAVVHARDEAGFDRAAAALRSAYVVGEVSPPFSDPVIERLT